MEGVGPAVWQSRIRWGRGGSCPRGGREGVPGPLGRNEAPGPWQKGQHLGSKLTAALCDPRRASPELGTLVFWGTMQTSCSPPVCAHRVFVGPHEPVWTSASQGKEGAQGWDTALVFLPRLHMGSCLTLSRCRPAPGHMHAHCRPASSSCPFSPGWGGLPAGATLGYPLPCTPSSPTPRKQCLH